MFVQRFEHGEPVAMLADAFDSVFRPHIDQAEANSASGTCMSKMAAGQTFTPAWQDRRSTT